MRISVSGSSYVQQLGLHDPMASGPLSPPTGAGNPAAYANRTYDNGYVNLDPGTGNPASLDPNTTWNWGFNNPSQYNAGAQTLNFQSTGRPGYTTLENSGAGGRDSLLAKGIQVVIGRSVMQSDNWSLDFFMAFQGTWSQHEHLTISTYSEEVRQMTVTDTYDVSGIGSGNFPANGFQGTYLGPFGSPAVVPSPVIPNQPQSRSSATSGVLSTSYNTIGFDVQQSLYEFGLGPQIGYRAGKRLELHLRPKITLNIIDAEVTRQELFVETPTGGSSRVINRWSDSNSECGVRFGMGITGGANLDLGHGLYVGVAGGYDFVPHSFEVPIGPNTIKLNPSGWEVSGIVGVRF